MEQKSREARGRDGDVESGVEPARLTGAFERYRMAIPELQAVRMLRGQAAFSRTGPLTAWVVIWLMIFQRLDAGGTLSAAVRELLTGGVRAFVRWPVESLSANTSAYSQARTKLPVALIEKVSDMIFDSLQAQLRSLPGLERPMFLLGGTSIQLQHSKELLEKWPPARNQHGSSHGSVIRVVVAHHVISGLAIRPCWGVDQGRSRMHNLSGDKPTCAAACVVNGAAAVSEEGLTKQIMPRLPADCGILGDRNFGVFSMAWHAGEQNHPCLFRLTEVRTQKLNGHTLPPAGTNREVLWVPSREDLRANPEIPADASVRGSLLAFSTKDSRGHGSSCIFSPRWFCRRNRS